VAANTDLSITFSEAVATTGGSYTLSCTTSGAHTFALSGGPTTWTLNPNADFTAGETCTLTVLAAGVSDQDANDPPDTMAANTVVSFTIDATPSVTATTPTNGAVQVATNANLVLTFGEAVNVTGNWFQIVCSTTGTRNATDTVVTGGPTAFSINPNVDFGSGETCTVTVFAAQVTDQDAIDPPDGMAANFVFSFTVDQAPGVTTTTPANGATGVVPGATITVNFTESVNATTSSFSVICNGSTQAFTLSASPAASFVLTPTTALPEGTICTVTVFAVQITDADAGDPPDNMLANHAFTFSIPPNAVNDSRGVTGNVPINTATTGFSVLSNDIGPGIAVTAFDATTVQGGAVSVNGAGVFTYTPPVGYEGIDSFTYTITNAAGSDTAAVNLTISGMLWFIDNTAGACTAIAGGCGRLGTPFSSLSAFNGVNGGGTVGGGDVIDPEAGDHIFIYTGAGNYTAPLALENSQRVIGQGATSSLAVLTGLTFAPDSIALPSTGGTKPTITSGGAGITLASSDQLHGLAFSNTAGTAVNGAVNVGTFTMSDVAITNTTGAGVSFSGGGTVTSTGINTIQTTTATALNVSNTTIGGSGLTFQRISTGTGASGPTNGIVLNTTGANAGLTVTGIGTTAGSGGTIQHSSGSGIAITSVRNLSLANMTISSNGDAIDEGGIRANELTGVASIANTTVTGSFHANGRVANTTGTLSLTISGSTFTSSTTHDGFDVVSDGTADVTTNISTSTFSNNFSDGFDGGAFSNSGTSKSAISITSSHFASNGANGILIAEAGGSNTWFNIHGNTDITSNPSLGTNLFMNNGTSTAGKLRGLVANNVITYNTVAGGGQGILLNTQGAGTATVEITNNTVNYTDGANTGITIQSGDGTGDFTNGHTIVKFTGNAVNMVDNLGNGNQFALRAINIESGLTAASTRTINLDMGTSGSPGDNTTVTLDSTSVTNGVEKLRVRERPNSDFTIVGIAPSPSTTAAQVQSFLSSVTGLATSDIFVSGPATFEINYSNAPADTSAAQVP